MDSPTPEEVEQAARSLARAPSLTKSERPRVIEMLRTLIQALRVGRR